MTEQKQQYGDSDLLTVSAQFSVTVTIDKWLTSAAEPDKNLLLWLRSGAAAAVLAAALKAVLINEKCVTDVEVNNVE